MLARALLATATVALGRSSHAHAAVTSSDICSSDAFAAVTATQLGDGPVLMRALVQDDEVCLEFSLSSSVTSDVAWLAVGISRDGEMVSSPTANVMILRSSVGEPVSYALSGYSSSALTEESDQSNFVVGSTGSTGTSFSYQRTLAAASDTDVAIDASGSSNLIWAYGDSWPITGHKAGTNGAATYNFAASGSSSSAGASATIGASSGSPPFCDDKNCMAIVGGAAFGIMALCGLLLTAGLKTTPVGKLLLHRTLAPPPVSSTTNAAVAKPHTMVLQNLADLHLGEVLVMLIFVGAIVVLVALNSDEESYMTSGQVSVLILMFLILPVARLPVWSVLFGSSFERIVKFHRWLGVAMTVAVIVHFVQALDVTSATQSEKYGSVTPLYGFVAFVCFMVMFVLSLEPVRRHFFEVFYMTHRVLSIVGFVFSILHAPKVIGWALCVPLALYALGLLYRWSSALTGVYKASVSVHQNSGSTSLVLEASAKTEKLVRHLNPGSYFFVRLPAISHTQWHPFSAIVHPDGQSLGFTIKAMRAGSFTRRLLDTAQTQHQVTANLCGPFGKLSLDVEHYDAVVLVAGGVGMTPLMSLINQSRLFPPCESEKAAKASDWHVVWSVREPEDILMLEEFLPTQVQLDYAARTGSSIQDPNTAVLSSAPRPLHINWMFHASEAQTDGVVTRANGETLSYRAGKPILDEVINTSRFTGRRVTVVACGPPTMIVEAQSLSRSCKFDFHKEVFNW